MHRKRSFSCFSLVVVVVVFAVLVVRILLGFSLIRIAAHRIAAAPLFPPPQRVVVVE